jgi:hypothetical protein
MLVLRWREVLCGERGAVYREVVHSLLPGYRVWVCQDFTAARWRSLFHADGPVILNASTARDLRRTKTHDVIQSMIYI